MKLFKKDDFDLLQLKIQEVSKKEDFIEFLIKSICPEDVDYTQLRMELENVFSNILMESILSGKWDPKVFQCKKHWKLYSNKLKNCTK